MPDKYDEAIEYLVANLEQINLAWSNPSMYPAGCLFQFCNPTGCFLHEAVDCGCLTQVHRGTRTAHTPELTQRIGADSRLHNRPNEIIAALGAAKTRDARRAILQPYAEWQREMDRTIRSK